METKSTTENITIKKESIGYFKSKFNLQQGTLTLTNTKIVLEAHKTAAGGLGILGAILKKTVEKSNTIFELEFSDILSIAQGKQGLEKNILEITDKQNITFRIVVKNYQEWEALINAQK